MFIDLIRAYLVLKYCICRNLNADLTTFYRFVRFSQPLSLRSQGRFVKWKILRTQCCVVMEVENAREKVGGSKVLPVDLRSLKHLIKKGGGKIILTTSIYVEKDCERISHSEKCSLYITAHFKVLI